jgi:ABC-2 type transport system permease protein
MTAAAVTQPRVVRSEWTKFITLRSTLWSLGIGMLLTLAFPIIFAAVTGSHWAHMSPHERADRHPLDIALAGVNVAQLAIAVLGVLVITGEYSTGMIRSTFLAVPKRLPVLWAKLGVYAVVAFALSLPAVIASFYASRRFSAATTSSRSRSPRRASCARSSAARSTSWASASSRSRSERSSGTRRVGSRCSPASSS